MNILWGKLVGFIFNLFGVLVVVLFGFVIVKLFDVLFFKLLVKLGLDWLMGGIGLIKLLVWVGIQVLVLMLVGKIVYWFVLFVFFVFVVELFGLQWVFVMLDVFVLYLFKVFGVVLVLIVGVFLV